MVGFPNQFSQIKQLALTRKVSVFLVTSVACVAMVCLLWPLGVQQFRSRVVINLQPNLPLTTDEVLTGLVQCVQVETASDRIADLVEATANQVALQSRILEARDIEAIQRSIQVGAERHAADGSIKFILAYDGEGFSDQGVFLDGLAARVVKQFTAVRHTAQQGLVRTVDPQSLIVQMDQALAAAEQIEQGGRAKSSPTASGRQFRMASSSRVVSAPEGISGSVGNVSDLKSRIHSMRQSMEQLVEQQPAFTVHQTSEALTLAVDATPPGYLLVLIVIGSIVAGSFTARHFDPFARHGFDSVDAVARQLKLPIAARLGTDEEATMASDAATVTRTNALWSQRVADACGWFLFALTLIIGGFLIIDVTIRDAFLQNPFDGLARMVRVFFGY